MNNTLKVSKYVFHDFKKALIIYYAIILSLFLLMNMTYLRISATPGSLSISTQQVSDVKFGGFGVSAMIFMFVSGLNCFKANFKFMQANNVTRKRFYTGTAIILILVAAIMALVDVSFNNIFDRLIPYEGMVAQIYNNNGFLPDFIWSFALMVLAASSGWFITTLYYRCSKIMRLVISFAPVFLIILITVLDKMTGGVLAKVIIKLLAASFGITSSNPYIAALSFFVAAAMAFGLCYILIRRVSIRD